MTKVRRNRRDQIQHDAILKTEIEKVKKWYKLVEDRCLKRKPSLFSGIISCSITNNWCLPDRCPKVQNKLSKG